MPAREGPLLEAHAEAGAKLVEFAGWRLPLYFSSVAEEAKACRSGAALFDISHMGVLQLLGKRARSIASRLLTRDVTAVPCGCATYSLLCNEAGGILDDLIALVVSEAAVSLVVNAANHDKDLAWIRERMPSDEKVEVDDLRGRSFGLALQGPQSEAILRSAGIEGRMPDFYLTFSQMRLAQADLLVSRTGYTGEDGFELFGAAGDGLRVWHTLVGFGRELGLSPAGLGARDVLRQEMGYPLWGQDLDENTTPLEAGLRWAVNWTADFIGRAALENSTPSRRRVGFVLQEQGIARTGCEILVGGNVVGAVTSGTYSHNLGAAIGQGYVSADADCPAGADISIEVRGRRLAARVARFPFLPAKTKPSWAHAKETKRA